MKSVTPKSAPQEWFNCGTHSGYVGHRQRGEYACERCRVANTEYCKGWRHNNRERYNEISYAWGKRNPDSVRANMRGVNRRRRARKLEVESEPYTNDSIIELYGCNCHVCSEPINLEAPRHPMMGTGWELGLQLDHLVPLAKGGNDKIENIRPIHVRCNILKGASTIDAEPSA